MVCVKCYLYFFMWGCMIVGECSGLVSCPAEIREGARGATWRHRDAGRVVTAPYALLQLQSSIVQSSTRYCAGAIIVGGGAVCG